MKPIEVIKSLVIDNDDDKQLGELVRQYVKELDQSNENEGGVLKSIFGSKK